MATGKLNPPYSPTFGVGTPGATVSPCAPYFDISAAPYAKYVNHAGAWHTVGGGAGIDATAIQGVNVKAAAPGANTILTYVAADLEWEGV